MKLLPRLAATTAAFALVATGCSSNDTSKSPASGSLKGESVQVSAVWSGEEQARFQKVLDAFAAKTGATVTFSSTGNDIATVLGSKISGGQPPDVAILPQPGLLADLARKGSLQPVDADTRANVEKNYAPIWKTLGTAGDGKLYGVWVKAANKSLIWYQAEKFSQAGVRPPKTWEEFTAALGTLSDAGTPPLAVGGGDGWVLTDWFENVYLRVAGAEKYDKLARHEIPFTDPTVVETLTLLGQLWGAPNTIPGGPASALQTKFEQSVTQVFGPSPKASVVFEGDFVATNIQKETGAKVGTTAKFFDFPAVKGSQPAVVGGGDVAVALKNSKGAHALLRWLATPEAAEVWARQGGFLSPDKSLSSSVYPDETSRKLGEAIIAAGNDFRFDMSDLAPSAFGGTPGSGEWKILQDFLANPADVRGTATKLEAAAAAAYK
ncbi:sugar ABC transporter substrate-binding protein [Longispora fulva]|uniref:Multiple sugar transport system substrate-binding protein/alpha-glucoside transport system substrate-binding protein n=1 Tax=Longispora fulva TaxID=619741 RepID=A0A8J7GHX5_9ACTN|nr:extracellular solute-binding protein [Longispora fulva]MBG6137830.1 multiple sugar transport system substrate-binding protein/alpha-glucoside transport system substrate-binding protein [Longispora fulva]GIG60085.1 sugar ABC transporter substrate-binding protein [Longispora fulva]